MSTFTILEQGQEPGKDQLYVRCLYDDHASDTTVIIDRQVLHHFKQSGASSVPLIVEAALDAAQEVEDYPTQVAILMETPILHTMMARLRHDRSPHAPT